MSERSDWIDNMSRADRLGNRKGTGTLCNDGMPHRWQPLSFRFEKQLLDDQGRVIVRQPDLREANIYVVCMECNTWTYVVAEWAGYYIGSPALADEPPDGRAQAARRHRAMMRRLRRSA